MLFVEMVCVCGVSLLWFMLWYGLCYGVVLVVMFVVYLIGFVFGGVVFVEMVFVCFGFGRVMFVVISDCDLFVIMGIILFSVFVFVVVNFVVEFVYLLIDLWVCFVCVGGV